MISWGNRRLKEGRGFVSRRIGSHLLFLHQLLYGNSFYINYGKFIRIFHPGEVTVKGNPKRYMINDK